MIDAIVHRMKLVDCYRLLGLREGAPYEAVKTAYRRLARQYHPDANPGDRAAQETFVRIAQAYEMLMADRAPKSPSAERSSENEAGLWSRGTPPTPLTSDERERQLKQQVYLKLQGLLQDHRYPRAVALVEGLAQRLPQDTEVLQWQAITYQHWARQLIQAKQEDKARVYLKKALRLVPENRTLTQELSAQLDRISRPQ